MSTLLQLGNNIKFLGKTSFLSPHPPSIISSGAQSAGVRCVLQTKVYHSSSFFIFLLNMRRVTAIFQLFFFLSSWDRKLLNCWFIIHFIRESLHLMATFSITRTTSQWYQFWVSGTPFTSSWRRYACFQITDFHRLVVQESYTVPTEVNYSIRQA